jgi:predicted O-methyltransferase YrrM
MAVDADAVRHARTAVATALGEYESADLSWLGREPTPDGWSLAPDALRFVYSLVRATGPRHVVEFGSGVSTQVLAQACSELGSDCAITSIENDPRFRRIAERAVNEAGLGVPVRFPTAFLVAREAAGRMRPAYLIESEEVASSLPADVVLIDGPATFLGGRSGTLHQALRFSRSGTIVLLDDANRPEEVAAIEGWRRHYGEAIEIGLLPEFAKGMAAIVIRDGDMGSDGID